MGYTGEQQDSLVYLRARYYHPALGRFLTPDSIVPDVLNGQDWNGYAYVRNNPVQWVDPRGHFGEGFIAEAGNALHQTGQWFGEKQQQAQDWWNKKECTCSPPQWSDLATVGSAGATLALGRFFDPINTHMTVTIEQYDRQHPNQPPTVERRSAPYTNLSDKGVHYENNLYVKGDGARISAADPKNGRIYTFGRDWVPNTKGLAAGLVGGMLVDAGIQWWQDRLRCLSNGDRLNNMLVAALAAAAVGLVGAAVFAVVLTALPTATTTAWLVSSGVAIIASNVGPIADMKNRALR